MARRIHDRTVEARSQQDNELWHLLILEELIAESDQRQPRIKFFWAPVVGLVVLGEDSESTCGWARTNTPCTGRTTERARIST
jgi:hypothetical protein